MRLTSCLLFVGAPLVAVSMSAAGGEPPRTEASPASGGWEFSVEYFAPVQSDRNIDVEVLEAARAWHLWRAFEIQARGGLFHANGTRTGTPWWVSPDSSATGISGGGGLRWYPVDLGALHLFADGSVQFLWTQGQPFPAGGSGLNFFLLGGAGLSYDVAQRFTIAAMYHFAHVSNGSGVRGEFQNPVWNGQGGGLSLRYRL